MRTLFFLSLMVFTNVAYADINQNDAPPAMHSLQYVNSATSQLNNNEPMMAPAVVEAPSPFPNQQARIDQNQQMQVPDVTLPYPLTPEPVAPVAAPVSQADPESVN